MHDNGHYSTALNMGMLSLHAMKNEVFRKIVRTKRYTVVPLQLLDKKDEFEAAGDMGKQKRLFTYVWENTNKILGDRSIGIKTGVTPYAGPCLSTYYICKSSHFIVVLLCCKSMDSRWAEAHKLCAWAHKRLKTLNDLCLKKE